MKHSPARSEPSETAARLAEVLLNATAAAQTSISAVDTVTGNDRSPFINLYKDASVYNAEVHVAQPFRYTQTAFLSACEHTRTVIALLPSPEPPRAITGYAVHSCG